MGDDTITLDNAGYILQRLREATEMRAQFTTVEYCIECDAIRGNPVEICDPEHTRVDGNHSHGGISEWIRCIEYFDLSATGGDV